MRRADEERRCDVSICRAQKYNLSCQQKIATKAKVLRISHTNLILVSIAILPWQNICRLMHINVCECLPCTYLDDKTISPQAFPSVLQSLFTEAHSGQESL